MTLTLTDLYAGAGGSSTGATSFNGMSVRIAANHWDRAIETHSRNHPDADHIQADITQIDPRNFPTTDVLWASPSCTNHSVAQGARRADRQPDLFGDTLPDEAAERSRATMWDVVRFTEHHRYLGVIVENVVDVVNWAPYEAWQLAMRSIGYTGQFVYLNSMHAQLYGPGAPQSRDRWYALFTRTGDRAPDVNRVVSPIAECDECGLVRARQVFKRGDRAPWGRYKAQYVYRCPNRVCGHRVVEPFYRPAADIIDWTLPGTRIGDRKRPLAAKTMARIEAGIQRYWEPMMVPVEGRDGKSAAPVSAPARTMTTRNETGLLVPTGGTWRTDATTTAQPMPTRTTRESDGIVFPPFIAELRGGSCDARPASEALGTVTASGNHHALVTAYYGSSSSARPASEALSTVTTLDRHGLLTAATTPPLNPITAADANFRMLEPTEIVAAMDFPTGYQMIGTRRERVRLAGNAVTPPAARDLVGILMEAITGSPAALAA